MPSTSTSDGRPCSCIRGVAIPLYVYLMYNVFGGFRRDRALYLTEAFFARLPLDLFVRLVVEGHEGPNPEEEEEEEGSDQDETGREERKQLATKFYNFVWHGAACNDMSAHLDRLVARVPEHLTVCARKDHHHHHKYGGYDNEGKHTESQSPSAVATNATTTTTTTTAAATTTTTTTTPTTTNVTADEIPIFTMTLKDLEDITSEPTPVVPSLTDKITVPTHESFNPHAGLPTLHFDGSTPAAVAPPTHTRRDDSYNRYNASQQVYTSGNTRYTKRKHLTNIRFTTIPSFKEILRHMVDMGREYDASRVKRFLIKNGGTVYCTALLLETPSLPSYAQRSESLLLLVLDRMLRDGYGEYKHLHAMHSDHLLLFPHPDRCRDPKGAGDDDDQPQVVCLVTRVFLALIQAMCLTTEARATNHFNSMPMTLRLTKRAFRLPPICNSLPARFGFLDSHLRAPLYQHLYYWVRSDFFRLWTWEMVAYPINSSRFQIYKLIFPILQRWTLVPIRGHDQNRHTILRMIQMAFSQEATAPDNILASMEAFFLQNKAERYHCISRRALEILYGITNYERSSRAQTLRVTFPVFVEYVRGLWSTYLNMPGSPEVEWIPLGFYPFTYSASWCHHTYQLYRDACVEAGRPVGETLRYRTWLQQQKRIYTPSGRIAATLYTACANTDMLNNEEARTVFLGIRTRAHQTPTYLANGTRQTHKVDCHINIEPPTTRDDSGTVFAGYHEAYPIHVKKPTMYHLADHYITMNRLYIEQIDRVSVPDYEPIMPREAHLLSEMAGIYETLRVLEFAYRLPQTLARPYRMLFDLGMGPIYVQDQDHLFKPCLYPSACIPSPSQPVGAATSCRILYDEYHLAYRTVHPPEDLYAQHIAPWFDILQEYPTYMHEMALLCAPMQYERATASTLAPIDGRLLSAFTKHLHPHHHHHHHHANHHPSPDYCAHESVVQSEQASTEPMGGGSMSPRPPRTDDPGMDERPTKRARSTATTRRKENRTKETAKRRKSKKKKQREKSRTSTTGQKKRTKKNKKNNNNNNNKKKKTRKRRKMENATEAKKRPTAMQTLHTANTIIPKAGRAPPSYNMVESGTLADGIRRAPLSLRTLDESSRRSLALRKSTAKKRKRQ